MKKLDQQGNSTVTVLVLLIGLAFVFACYNPDKIPSRLQDALPDHQSQSEDTDTDADTYQVSNHTYTVQVVATPSREEAFSFKRALMRDGYSARVEKGSYGRKGIYYKVRIGRYDYQSDAIAVKDRIKRMYIKHFGDSFVYRY